MERKTTLLTLVVLTVVLAPARTARAQDMSTVANTTNACINSTYRSFSPNATSPTFILIDRRVTFDPVANCVTAGMMSAFCSRDGGTPMLLIAQASSAQFANSPYCRWNCGACGIIETDGSIGLPVELMDFGVDDEVAGESPEPDSEPN